MANSNTESSSSYGALERFLIWFLIPFVFTAVLLGVLFSILDFNVLSGVQRTLHNVPVIGNYIPEPVSKTNSADNTKGNVSVQNKDKDQEISRLGSKVSSLESDLKKANEADAAKVQVIKDLEAKLKASDEKLAAKTQSDEEYAKQIQQLANDYAIMSPSKSAPIIENLSTKEAVMVMNMMKPAERVAIFEKMDPKKAATISISLKDVVLAKDSQIAALQERLSINATEDPNSKKQVTEADLALTFAKMTPKSSASILLEMYGITPSKVISILSGMDVAARSQVMSAMADVSKTSKATAAEISAQLVK
jgi:flagellar motility protein MotE (MotC chaperone)